MKQTTLILFILLLCQSPLALAQGRRDPESNKPVPTQPAAFQPPGTSQVQPTDTPEPQSAIVPPGRLNPTPVPPPARIILNRPSRVNEYQALPLYQPGPSNQASDINIYDSEPHYWNGPALPQPAISEAPPIASYDASSIPNSAAPTPTVVPSDQTASTASNVAHHHHPFTPGYVRKRLQKLGVTNLPNYITDRIRILDTNKLQSSVPAPRLGPDKKPLTASLIPEYRYSDPIVKDQLAILHNRAFAVKADKANKVEKLKNHFYWHKEKGFTYCHYIDPQGFHWYGWYMKDNCFWTCYFGGHWWFFDTDHSRWCFYENGWWWQDPYHVGDLYYFNNGEYIPCDSAKDAVVMTVQTNNQKVVTSPDGSRTVKIIGDGRDAFLYDNSATPSFSPLYLASKVTAVKFSNTDNGQPLRIMVTMDNGASDLYDSEGTPLDNFVANAQPAETAK
jgi:hypothetical protein